jgi:hypothetical protein
LGPINNGKKYADWHKDFISKFPKHNKKFIAWPKEEQQMLFILRVFLLAKYNIQSTPAAFKLLKTYNPYNSKGTFEI